MTPLAQFKQENNIASITVMQYSTGRKFFVVGNKTVVISKSCDTSKPTFVTQLNNWIDPTDHSKGSVPAGANEYVLVNASKIKVLTETL